MSIFLITNLIAIRSFNGLLVRGDSSTYAGAELVRYQMKKCRGNLSFEGALELSIYYGQTEIGLLSSTSAENYFNWSRELIDRIDLKATAYIDRLNLRWSTDNLDITAGRQAIGLGKGHHITLWDAFAPFTPYSVDFSFRRGVDAVRIGIYMGNTEWTYILAQNPRHTLSFGMGLSNFDVQTILLLWGDTLYGGFALEGNIPGGVLWTETVLGPEVRALSIGFDGVIRSVWISAGLSTSGGKGIPWYPAPSNQAFASITNRDFHGWSIGTVIWYGKLTEDVEIAYLFGKKESDYWDLTLFSGVVKSGMWYSILGLYARWFF